MTNKKPPRFAIYIVSGLTIVTLLVRDHLPTTNDGVYLVGLLFSLLVLLFLLRFLKKWKKDQETPSSPKNLVKSEWIFLSLSLISFFIYYQFQHPEPNPKVQAFAAKALMVSGPVEKQEFREEEFGKATVYIATVNQLLHAQGIEFQTYADQIKELRLQETLNPDYWENPDNVADAHDRLHKMEIIVSQGERNVRALYDQGFANMIENGELSRYEKDQLLIGYNKIKEEKSKNIDEYWDIQHDRVKVFDACLEYLEMMKSEDLFTSQDGQFAFLGQAGLDEYNRHVQRIQEVDAREQQWWKQEQEMRKQLVENVIAL